MPYTPYTRNTAYVLPVVDDMLAILNDGMNPYKQELTVDDLEVLQLKKDGSLYLTSGTLEDSNLAKPRKSPTTTKPEQTVQPQPEVPDQGEETQPPITEEVPQEESAVQPEAPTQGEQPDSENVPQPEQPVQPDPPLQPEEPEQSTQQTGGETQENTGDEVNILPATPVPVQ